MASYEEAFSGLNDAQRLAVTTTEGPVLVIAGPGTGKTQLLTTRIAHILKTTDILPQNILCLTFTESAAQTMRERLSSMIGQGAYDITISTYHSFGSDLIRRFPDYFTELSGQRPVDDLVIDTIFRSILDNLPYSNPLKFADMYLGDIKTFVSDAKRALLTPADIRIVAKHNLAFLKAAQPAIGNILGNMVRIDKKSIPLFSQLASKLEPLAGGDRPHSRVQPFSSMMLQDLKEAASDAELSGKTTSLTKWKNAWLAKDDEGQFVVDGAKANNKLLAAADIYEEYLTELAARELFDYDDMILRAVSALENNPDLRFTLQERYLYMLLDEFQDTNGAQLRLVELLADNPVNEGRPNILAVGDDDQAIYAFQGADYSHMLKFQQNYRDVAVIPLTENYRSHTDILSTAQGIAVQIEERLHHNFPEIDKTLTAKNDKLPKEAVIERRESKSDVGQFAWTAKQIKKLIKSGIPASEIAVLAPQHKYIEPLVPFLHEAGVPVRYEKRENVLDDPAVTQLLRMSELCLALAAGKHRLANALWVEVLSFPFWRLPTSTIWSLSWQASDDNENWTEVLLDQPELDQIALFFIRLSMQSGTETLETMLDYLIGAAPLDLQEPNHKTFTSPFYEYYFRDISGGGPVSPSAPSPSSFLRAGRELPHGLPPRAPGKPTPQPQANFWQLLTDLTVLRSRLREYRAHDGNEPLQLADFIEFVLAHQAANIKILNTSPYQEADEAVQLMTAYKAKGMEFAAVFVLAVNDEAWGSKARTQSTRLSLPPNLQFIRYAGATNDERLRLFYVAVTRAKSQLYLVNYTSNFAGKGLTRLKYLNEQTDDQGVSISPLLPEGKQVILPTEDNGVAPTTELEAYWHQRHQHALTKADFHALLRPRLERFQLSPTHVNAFINLEHQGPAYFFMNTILRFPKAPVPAGEFGNAIHETLEWIHIHNRQHGKLPARQQTVAFFEQRLRSKHLSELNTQLFLERGKVALGAYLTQRSHTVDAASEVEFNFRNEGVFIGKAHMAGKIDKLVIDKTKKTITIVDYKTGKSYHRWIHDAKLHRYKQQLYLYKALVEGSHSFRGYTVTDAYLEFIEPDDNGNIQELHLAFDKAEETHTQQLAEAIWQHIQAVDIPDASGHSTDIKGIEAFEQFLLGESEDR